MKLQTHSTVSIGPGTLEEILIDGLRKRGLIRADVFGAGVRFYYKTFLDKQKEIHVNEARITFETAVEN